MSMLKTVTYKLFQLFLIIATLIVIDKSAIAAPLSCEKRALCVNMINETPFKIKCRYSRLGRAGFLNWSNWFEIMPGASRLAIGDDHIHEVETIVYTTDIPMPGTAISNKSKPIEIKFVSLLNVPRKGKKLSFTSRGTYSLKGPAYGPNVTDQLFKYEEFKKNTQLPIITPAFWNVEEAKKAHGHTSSYIYKAGQQTYLQPYVGKPKTNTGSVFRWWPTSK